MRNQTTTRRGKKKKKKKKKKKNSHHNTMVKRVIRRKKKVVGAPTAGAGAFLSADQDEEATGVLAGEAEAAAAAAAAAVDASGDDDDSGMEDGEEAEVARRLRTEALKAGGREHRSVARLSKFGEAVSLPAARGTPTCALVTEGGEWVWYGDKNGHVWRCHLPTRSAWTAMGRHKGKVLCIAETKVDLHQSGVYAAANRTSSHMADAKTPHMIATGGTDGMIKIFNATDGTEVHELVGHRGPVTGLCFRLNKTTLYSGGHDRTLKIWDADTTVLLDTLFGHTGKVTGVSACWKEEAVTCGDDRTVRLFRIERATQSTFSEARGVVESCTCVNDSLFVTGSQDGTFALHSHQKRKPLDRIPAAHGLGFTGDGDGLEQTMSHAEICEGTATDPAARGDGHANWVTSTAAVPYSDLVASGGVGGGINVYELAKDGAHPTDFIDPSTSAGFGAGTDLHKLRKLRTLAVNGVVNSVYFDRRGSHLVATVGREPRLGRWYTHRDATPRVVVYPISLSEDAMDDVVPSDEGLDEDDAAVEAAEEAAAAAAAVKKAPAKKLVSKPVAKGGKRGRVVVRRRVVNKAKRQINLK